MYEMHVNCRFMVNPDWIGPGRIPNILTEQPVISR